MDDLILIQYAYTEEDFKKKNPRKKLPVEV